MAPEDEALARSRAAHTSDQDMGWYVYGVTSAAALPIGERLPGIDSSQAVTSLPGGDLAAVVSAVPLSDFDEAQLREHLGDMAWVEHVARRHEEVLDAVIAERTIVPMRMCTIYRDEAGVRAMLTREAPAMSAALSELENRSEWGLKVFAGPRGSGPDPSGEEPGQPMTGAAYMAQRQREQRERGEADQQRWDAAEDIFARLQPVAVRASVIPPQRPEVSGHPGTMLLNSVYLVADDERGAFQDTVDVLQDEYRGLGIELQMTGPWPAYNFVPDAIGSTP